MDFLVKKKTVTGMVIACLLLLGLVSQVMAGDEGSGKSFYGLRTLEVKMTNLTRNIILTPPIFATSRRPIHFYALAQPAEEYLEVLAEGGDTSLLDTLFTEEGAQDVVVAGMPIVPGETATFTIRGNSYSFLHMASMLLPTNDGFVAVNGISFWHLRKGDFYLKAYDAGTEENDELFVHIPGPFDGEGFNAESGEGRVTPHPGIHGFGDAEAMFYNWGEPVAKISVTIKR